MELNTLNQDMLVRFIRNESDTADDTDVIVVHRLHTAILKDFKRDTDIMELYESSHGQNLGDGDFLVNKNKLFASSVVMPSTIEDMISHYNIEADIAHGVFLNWAIAHSFLSSVIYLLSKHKDELDQYIDGAIYEAISFDNKVAHTILDYLIDHYGYDIHKKDEYLFRICAMGKKYSMTDYLLERGAKIPIGIYRAYQLNAKKYKHMWKLIKGYEHAVIGE